MTSNNVTKAEPVEPSETVPSKSGDDRLIDELVGRAQAEGLQLTGEGGLLQQLTKRLLESALEGEITDHLGYDKHDPVGKNGGNSRDGTRAKTVLTDVGPVEIAVPRDREGSFEPKIVKPVYTAATEDQALDRFAEFADAWGKKHPAIVRLWENAWEEFTPFLRFDTEIRRIVCTTNAIESVNARIRRAVKARGHFPNEQAALKCVYMAIMSLDPSGKGQGPLDHALENRSQRLRYHLRRPTLRSPPVTLNNPSYTARLTAPAELTGTSIDPAQRHSTQQPGDRAERWRDRLREAGVVDEHIKGVLNLLALLFPTVQKDLGNGSDTKAAAQRRGIGSTDYFDRYMVFGIPDDDLPEAAFDQALAQLTADAPGEEAAELLLRLRDDTHRITRRIEQRRSAGIRLPAAALLKAMADSYGQLTAEPEMIGLVNSGMSMQFLARDLLTDLPPEQRAPVLAAMAASPDGAVPATRTLHRATNPNNNDSEEVQTAEDWSLQARDAVTERIAQHLVPTSGRPAEELTESDTDLIWMWRHTRPDSLRPWLRQRLDNGWEPLPLLGKLLHPAPRPHRLIDESVLAGLDAMVGLEDLYTRLDPLLETQTSNNSADEHHTNILQALRDHRPSTGQTPPPDSVTTT